MRYIGDSPQRYANAYRVQAPIRAWAANGGIVIRLHTSRVAEGCRHTVNETLDSQYNLFTSHYSRNQLCIVS